MKGEREETVTRLSVGKKLVFSAAPLILVGLVLEAALWAAGVVPLKGEADPFVGFEPGTPLFVRQGEHYVTNAPKLAYFNPQKFAFAKSTEIYRVFVLGGSTTYGRPYDDRTSYVGQLRRLLQAGYPERSWEIVNCGGISYASYRLAGLMDELVDYEPDLFIVHTGHNEFLEERSFREVRQRGRFAGAAFRALSNSRTATLVHRLVRPADRNDIADELLPAEVDTILDHTFGPETYGRDAELRANVVRQFGRSLDHLLSSAARADADVILITPASNLRDFSPFKSEHGPIAADEQDRFDRAVARGRRALEAADYPGAAEVLLAAAGVDPLHAEGQYLTGRALSGLGRREEAREHFVRGRDEDVCPLRALTEIQALVRETAASRRLPLIDFDAHLVERCRRIEGQPTPGNESFLDHVHPTIEVHRELALLIGQKLVELDLVPASAELPRISEATLRSIRGGIDAQGQAIALFKLAQTLSWAGRDAEALELIRRAESKAPHNGVIVGQHARLLEKQNRTQEALAKYEQAVRLAPRHALTWLRLGSLQLQRREYHAALGSLERARSLASEREPRVLRAQLHLLLGDCLQALSRADDARREYDAVLRLEPTNQLARERLQALP
jgi:tetratricopeptide (TPR) repeat protein